jgi:predicted nucleic acid-binding protein
VIYLDSSALIKLVLPEPESAALEAHLARAADQLASSKLAIAEVHRALTRIEATEDDRAAADELLEDLALLPLDDAVLRRAAGLPGRHLRSLDALHVATACGLGAGLAALVTYDVRMLEVCTGLGLRVVRPGAVPSARGG